MTELKLNKCQCGGEADIIVDDDCRYASVECKKCARFVSSTSAPKVAQMWNAANHEPAQELKDPCVGCENTAENKQPPCDYPCKEKAVYLNDQSKLSKRREQDEQKGLFTVIANQRRQLRILNEQIAKMKQDRKDDVAGSVQAIKDETQKSEQDLKLDAIYAFHNSGSILARAQTMLDETRKKEYGDAVWFWEHVARTWGVKTSTAALMMTKMKIERCIIRGSDDDYIDAAAYVEIAYRAKKESEANNGN